MKFSCSQLSLSKAINTVSKAVSIKTTMPILKGIYISVKGNYAVLSASNLDLGFETTIDVQTYEEGSLVVSDARLFGEMVRRLPNAIVSVETDERENITVSCLGSKFSLACLPADEFPSIGVVESERREKISKDLFKSMIDKTSFAASIDEKKGVLVGCLLNFGKEKIEAVSLDGYRMALARENAEFNEERSIIVPAKNLNEIGRVLSEAVNENIEFSTDSKKLEIVCENTRIITRLLEGEFIKYNDIIPKTHKTRVCVSREELQSSLERAALLSKEGKNNLVKFVVEDGRLTINSRNEEGNINEEIDVEKEGEDITIGFNSKYFIDSLKNIKEEEIAIEMNTPISASLIKPVDGDSFIYLVLPVRISVN